MAFGYPNFYWDKEKQTLVNILTSQTKDEYFSILLAKPVIKPTLWGRVKKCLQKNCIFKN